MRNLFKIDNKDILLKKEHDKEMFIVHLKKVLDMLQYVKKETQSPLLTFNRFHILFWGFCCYFE